jgi:hypothetical protein
MVLSRCPRETAKRLMTIKDMSLRLAEFLELIDELGASGLPTRRYAASLAFMPATVAAVHTATPAGVGKPPAVSFAGTDPGQ